MSQGTLTSPDWTKRREASVSNNKQNTRLMSQVPNLRTFKVKFLGPTNHRGARVSITEPAARHLTIKHRLVLSYDYAVGDILKQAVSHLQSIGINVTCTGYEGDGEHCIMADNWGSNFIELTK